MLDVYDQYGSNPYLLSDMHQNLSSHNLPVLSPILQSCGSFLDDVNPINLSLTSSQYSQLTPVNPSISPSRSSFSKASAEPVADMEFATTLPPSKWTTEQFCAWIKVEAQPVHAACAGAIMANSLNGELLASMGFEIPDDFMAANLSLNKLLQKRMKREVQRLQRLEHAACQSSELDF